MIASDELDIMIFALRYAASKQNYEVSLVCDYIKSKLPLLNDEQRWTIAREVTKVAIPAQELLEAIEMEKKKNECKCDK